MSRLETLSQPPALAKMAYAALRDSILAGRLASGEVYTEAALAKELGISKTPVREALLELAAQGLVTVLPRRGVMVTRFTERDVEEVFEVRRAVEAVLVEKVARSAGELDLAPLEQALEAQEDALRDGDMLAFLDADRAFHTGMGELAGNRRLRAILENARDMIHLMGMEALTRRGRPSEVLEEHRKVVDALRNGRPSQARQAMDRHLERSQESVLSTYRGDTEPEPAQ
ncbi:MAG: GntR family transcriptional regulator [Deferrisomatales bacterium]